MITPTTTVIVSFWMTCMITAGMVALFQFRSIFAMVVVSYHSSHQNGPGCDVTKLECVDVDVDPFIVMVDSWGSNLGPTSRSPWIVISPFILRSLILVVKSAPWINRLGPDCPDRIRSPYALTAISSVACFNSPNLASSANNCRSLLGTNIALNRSLTSIQSPYSAAVA